VGIGGICVERFAVGTDGIETVVCTGVFGTDCVWKVGIETLSAAGVGIVGDPDTGGVSIGPVAGGVFILFTTGLVVVVGGLKED
jgi:hypothetical protein